MLAEEIRKSLSKPFVWGEHDCCLFACDVVKALTGEDMAHDFRGKYTNKLEAVRVIKEFAGGGLAELAAKRAAESGLKEAPIPFAGRGDVVLVDNNGHDALGIVMDGRAVCAGPDGLVFLPRKLWKTAWKVGE